MEEVIVEKNGNLVKTMDVQIQEAEQRERTASHSGHAEKKKS